MPSCRVSVCLLVLLGAVWASGNPLKDMPDNIADLLRLKEPEVGSHPLFSSFIRSINTSCPKKENLQLMNATLAVYTRMFSNILQHHLQDCVNGVTTTTTTSALLHPLSGSERENVTKLLCKLLKKTEKLRGDLNRLNHRREAMLLDLNKIKVDDPLDQRRALAEFDLVFMTAFEISHSR